MTSIGRRAFSDNFKMTAVNLPQTVSSIGDEVFFACNALTSVSLPSTIGNIGEGVFASCDLLNQVIWSTNLTSVPKRMFYQCESLEWITLPSNVSAIGESAFGECCDLKWFEFPSSLKTIGDRAFEYCGFEEIRLPASLVSVGAGAFNSNHDVREIYIPQSVTSIGADAFNNSPHIELVKVDRAVPPILGTNGFHQYTYFSALLSVPDDAVITYKKASEWCNFEYINENPNVGVPEISEEERNPIFYDLQGRPLSHPSGIYIRRENNCSSLEIR